MKECSLGMTNELQEVIFSAVILYQAASVTSVVIPTNFHRSVDTGQG
jgi:hypothetical protein